jgi:hypothetical protein
MRRTTITLLALLVLSTMSLWIVLADSPHFLNNRTGASCSGDGLRVCFKEVGLGTGPIDYILEANGSATYQCFTRSGNVPQAENKRSNVPLTVTKTLFPDKNGNIADCLVLSPAPPDSGFSCPKGQVMRGPFNVSYSDVSLTDDTNNVSANGLPSFVACP